MSFDETSTSASRTRQAGRTAGGRVRLRTLVLARWVAVTGQTTTIFFVYFGLGYDLPLLLALLTVAASVALNIFLTMFYPSSTRLSDTQAAYVLAYDTLQIAVLLLLNGGLHNPFSVLMLAAVTISATILSLRSTVWLGALTLACVSTIVFVHLPLPWSAGEHSLSHLYVFGTWTALVVGMAFFSIYALRVAEEGRRISDALTETQMELAREQSLSALGSLAAAAAHELGTPLGTIALVAKEMSRDLPADSPQREDFELLVDQSDRCRAILAQLTHRSENENDDPFYHLPLMAFIESIAAHHRRDGVIIDVAVDPANEAAGERASGGTAESGFDQPMVSHRLEIFHGLGNLIQNAVDFANRKVVVTARWSATEVGVEITDDGPGFARGILSVLGEPYVSTRRNSEGMGLGVFIAKTLLERTGAELVFGNHPDGGARIVITWPRALIENHDREPAPGMPETTYAASRKQ